MFELFLTCSKNALPSGSSKFNKEIYHVCPYISNNQKQCLLLGNLIVDKSKFALDTSIKYIIFEL